MGIAVRKRILMIQRAIREGEITLTGGFAFF
jgi:hypothetical protein